MRKFFAYAQDFIGRMSIWDMGIFKFCLCSLGVLIGLSIPKEKKKVPMLVAVSVFAASYATLMARFLEPLILKHKQL